MAEHYAEMQTCYFVDSDDTLCYHVGKCVSITSFARQGRAQPMIRTQVQLTEEQARTLRALAAQRQSSVAELIRQSVDSFIARSVGVSVDERRRRAIAAIGRYSSGCSDISVNHDQYLDEAYSQ